ncbi:class I SAM-dependent methyltransferase, partial [Patescibacteria group bacterium]|nr:class I SAM-dependent methyltransferase [Patescibacteria group bacterium]
MNKQGLYRKLAKYYDRLYQYKDYRTEAKFVDQLIRKKGKRGISILDLACGTGNHVKEFVKFGYKVVGLDVSEEMLKIAKRKVPKASFMKGNMQNFSLNQKFEAITCLFSSIQYNLTINQLKDTFKCFGNHLTSDGLFIFDVAYCQERWKEGYSVISTYKGSNLELGLFAQSRSKNKISIWQPLILIKDRGQI